MASRRIGRWLFVLLLGLASTTAAEDKKKIVFISGKPSHGPMKHEHRAGNMILADALNRSGLNVDAVLVPHPGYPKDKSILQDAATVVIFCTALNNTIPVIFSSCRNNSASSGC